MELILMFIAGMLITWVVMSVKFKIYKRNVNSLFYEEIEELTDYIQQVNGLSEARADLIKQTNKCHELYKNQYKTLNDILNLESDEDKFKQLDDLHTAIIYVSKEHNYKDNDFENIVWQLRNHVQFEKSYWIFKSLEYRENELYPMIKNKIVQKIKNAKLIEKINDPNHRPDLWIKLNEEEIPVEVKKFDFGKPALKQLQRYMKFYETNKGIAIAKNLKVELPSNIQFISIDELKEVKE